MSAGSGAKAALGALSSIFGQAASVAMQYPKITLVGLYMVFNFFGDTRQEYHTLPRSQQNGQISYLIEDTIKDGVRFTVNIGKGLYNGVTGAWDENFGKSSNPAPRR